MQAVFFLSLFSLIFLMFSSITAGLGRNIMQENVEKRKETIKRFEAIEIGLNVLAYKEKTSSGVSIVDLSNNDVTDLAGTFLASKIPYTVSQISKDPWHKPVKLFKHTKREAIWGSPDGGKAEAPITTIMLISAGPNGRYDTLDYIGVSQSAGDGDLTENQIKLTDISDKDNIGDDIVTRFNNYDAMLEIWDKTERLDNTIKNVAFDYYRGKLDAFTPLIQLAERDTNNGGLLSTDVFGDLESEDAYLGFAALTDNANAYATSWNDPSTKIYEMLEPYRERAKAYDNGFELGEDTTESNALNAAFNDKYSGVEFQYPSFDIVEKDSNGALMPEAQRGLKNLGFTNLASLDPFSGTDMEVTYEYDSNKPNELTIKREVTPGAGDTDKWEIVRKIKIDGLGG